MNIKILILGIVIIASVSCLATYKFIKSRGSANSGDVQYEVVTNMVTTVTTNSGTMIINGVAHEVPEYRVTNTTPVLVTNKITTKKVTERVPYGYDPSPIKGSQSSSGNNGGTVIQGNTAGTIIGHIDTLNIYSGTNVSQLSDVKFVEAKTPVTAPIETNEVATVKTPQKVVETMDVTIKPPQKSSTIVSNIESRMKVLEEVTKTTTSTLTSSTENNVAPVAPKATIAPPTAATSQKVIPKKALPPSFVYNGEGCYLLKEGYDSATFILPDNIPASGISSDNRLKFRINPGQTLVIIRNGVNLSGFGSPNYDGIAVFGVDQSGLNKKIVSSDDINLYKQITVKNTDRKDVVYIILEVPKQ